MKKFLKISMLLVCIIFTYNWISSDVVGAKKDPILFTNDEQAWIDSHKHAPLVIGFDPYAGMDYFMSNDKLYGYLNDIVKLIQDEAGLNIIIDDEKNWGEAYTGLFGGNIDILFGANPTPERLKTMTFTQSVHRYPYSVLTIKNSEIHTIGDLDGRKIGFLEGDMVIDVFKTSYKNITYSTQLYANQILAIEAMINGEIDGFITSGGEVIYEYLYRYQEIHSIAELKNIYSEMTFSTLKENEILVDILNKIIEHKSDSINQFILSARVNYIRKILNLSPEEISWLESDPTVKVGIATDYLPVDYYANGYYSGIAGEFFTEFCTMIGLNIECVPLPFDALYQKMVNNEIDILNMAKTEDRGLLFNFTDAFSNDRDAIYGLKSSPTVYDIYGLEGSRIAIIEGFWHEEYLRKNLHSIDIIFTKDIKETLDLIDHNKADYFLENPSVAEYYIEGLGYNKVVKKGTTSADSFLYFGCQKDIPEFVSIFNKTLKLIDYEKAKYEGIQNAPALKNVQNVKLSKILAIILTSFLIVTLSLIKLFKELTDQKAKTKMLKEREHLIYTDALTGLYNRLYFNALEKKMADYPYPHSFIMIDLNHLKITNDTYGHRVGDLLIQSFAEILKLLVPHERIMRMGGDEFFIFLENFDECKTQDLIKSIKIHCETNKVPISEEIVLDGLIPSIGYYIKEDDSVSIDEALHIADQKMYADKQCYYESFK